MHHVPDGVLRRLADEPFAVPDHDIEHVQRCRRCQARRDRVLGDASTARELLARPQPVPDLERAWDRLGRGPHESTRRVPARVRPRRLAGATGVALVSTMLVAGVAAAATLTVVFSPSHVAPLSVSRGDLQSLVDVLGLGQSALPTGRSERTWAYGTVQWTSRPQPVKTTSLGAAESAAGMTLSLPPTLPVGVQGPPEFLAVPTASVVVSFDQKAGSSLAGSSLTVDLGPGLLAEYGGVDVATGALGHVPALVVGAMQRPSATSTGATTTQLESFLLGRRGFPRTLAQEIRLLGNLKGVLPVPVPAGMTQTSTTVAGSPAVFLSAAGGTAGGVVWERGGVVRTVGGLVDQRDVMDVARQLG